MASYFGNNALKTDVFFKNNKIKYIFNGNKEILTTSYIGEPGEGFVPSIVNFYIEDQTQIKLEVTFNLSNLNLESGSVTLSNVIAKLDFLNYITEPGRSEDFIIGIDILEGTSIKKQTVTVNYEYEKTEYSFSLEDININAGSSLKNYITYTENTRWVRL